MTTLPELPFDYDRFLDRTTILYGESMTGKSTVIIDILKLLSPHVDQIIVISPTDRQNHTYDKGVVPLPMIHYGITGQLLDKIWERQSALASVYTKANKPEIFKQLFDRIRGNNHSRDTIEEAADIRDERIRDVKRGEENKILARSKIDDIDKSFQKFLSLVYKTDILEYRDELSRMNLSEDEKFSLNYVDFNPRIVIIFDDCTDQLKKFRSHPVMQKLFFQGRWNFVTTLIAAHTDKALDPEVKKNSFTNIFTGPKAAQSYFARPSNDFDKNEKVRAVDAMRQAFTPTHRHQKLILSRAEDTFYRYTATLHGQFRFGSREFWRFCDEIKSDGNQMAPGNKFIQDFM